MMTLPQRAQRNDARVNAARELSQLAALRSEVERESAAYVLGAMLARADQSRGAADGALLLASGVASSDPQLRGAALLALREYARVHSLGGR